MNTYIIGNVAYEPMYGVANTGAKCGCDCHFKPVSQCSCTCNKIEGCTTLQFESHKMKTGIKELKSELNVLRRTLEEMQNELINVKTAIKSFKKVDVCSFCGGRGRYHLETGHELENVYLDCAKCHGKGILWS